MSYLAIGAPGQAVRVLLHDPGSDFVALQMQPGEVGIATDTLGEYAISADGRALIDAPLSFSAAQLQTLGNLAALANQKLSLWVGGSAPAGGVQVDDSSRTNILGALAMAQLAAAAGAPFSERWIMADNSVRVFSTASEFVAFAQAIGAYYAGCVKNNAALKAQILAVADATALAAIDITAGWPQ